MKLPYSLRVLDTSLVSVKAFGRHDVWAVGAAPPLYSRVVIHWDGHRWTRITPPVPSKRGWWTTIDGSSPTDVWIYGMGVRYGQVLDHWDGTSWSIVPVDAALGLPVGDDMLAGDLRVFSPTDVWIVGADVSGCCSELPVVAHYNGASWTRRQLADVFGTQFATVADLDGTSAANLWAVGNGTAAVEDQELVYHWNPPAWQAIIPFPQTQPTDRSYGLYGVEAISPTDVWATGSWINGVTQAGFHDFFAHYDATQWQRLKAPRIGGVGDIASVPGTQELVAVGSTDTFHPLVETRDSAVIAQSPRP